MGTLTITDPVTGKSQKFAYDGAPPSDQEVQGLISQAFPTAPATVKPAAPAPLPQFDQDSKALGAPTSRPVVGGITVATFKNGTQGFYGAQGERLGKNDPRVQSLYAKGDPHIFVTPEMDAAQPDIVDKAQQWLGEKGKQLGDALEKSGIVTGTVPGAILRAVNPKAEANVNKVVSHDIGGVVAGVPAFALGTAQAVGANVGAALAQSPEQKAAAEQKADQFSKDFVGSIIGAPHLDPNDKNATTGWAAQAYKAVGYLHAGDRAQATQAAKNVALALGKGAAEHPIMTALGAVGLGGVAMGAREAVLTLREAKEAAKAVGDVPAAEGAAKAEEHLLALTGPVEGEAPVAAGNAPAEAPAQPVAQAEPLPTQPVLQPRVAPVAEVAPVKVATPVAEPAPVPPADNGTVTLQKTVPEPVAPQAPTPEPDATPKPAEPAKPAPAKPDMAASINLGKVSPDADVQQATRDSVDRTGTTKQRVSWDERRKSGKELNMQVDELRDLPVGQLPVDEKGVPVNPNTFKDNIRNVQAHYAAEDARTFREYQQAVKEGDPKADDYLKANQAARDAQDAVTPHVSHWAGEAGRGLNEQRNPAEGYAPSETVRVRKAIEDTPSLDDVTKPAAPEFVTAGKPRKGQNRSARRLGEKNKGVTLERLAEIDRNLAAVRKNREAQWGTGLKGVIREMIHDETGAFDLDITRDLIDLGMFYIEAGAREFADWLPKMRSHLGPELDDATAMALYAHTKTAIVGDTIRKQRDTAGMVFTDQLANRFGSRKAVSAFLDQIVDEDGTHTILDKLIHGKSGELTADQKATLEKAYRDNTKKIPPRKPSMGAMAAVDRIVDEQRQARVAATRKPVAAKAPPTIADTFKARIRQGLGEAGADAFYHDVASDPASAGALAKLHSGAPMTAADYKPLVDAYARNKPSMAGKKAAGAYDAFNKALAQARKDASAEARALPESRLDVTLGRRVGPKNVEAFKASLASRPHGASALDKLRSGDVTLTNDEKTVVAEALQDAKLPRRKGSGDELAGTLGKIMADAKAGRLNYDDPVQRTRKLLVQIAPERSDEITRTLAGIETDASGKPTPDGYKALLDYKQQVSRDVAKSAFKALSVPMKITTGAAQVANAARSLTTSFDLSAPGRQGGFLVAANPRMALKSFPDMIKAFVDEKTAANVAQQIESRENAPLYKKSGLYIAPMDEFGGTLHQLSTHEEAYMSQLAERIPILGKGVRGSERAYVTFLNKLRADNFDMFVRDLKHTGREPTEGDLKQIATFINDATGRGDMGKMNSAAPLLNTVYFSPRFAWSRARLAVGAPLIEGTGGLTSRKLIARTYVQAAAGAAAVLGLLKLAGADVNATDPTRSDFLKAKFKNHVIVDPMAGFSQMYTLMAREFTGKTTTQAGATVPLDGNGMHGSRFDVLARYSRSKLSPMAGTAVDLLSGKNYIGEPVTAFGTKDNHYMNGEIARNVIPMSLPDFTEAATHEGVAPALGVLAFNTFGLGANYQPPKPPKSTGSSPGLGSLGNLGSLGSLGKL